MANLGLECRGTMGFTIQVYLEIRDKKILEEIKKKRKVNRRPLSSFPVSDYGPHYLNDRFSNDWDNVISAYENMYFGNSTGDMLS